jgi:hypothetical protein
LDFDDDVRVVSIVELKCQDKIIGSEGTRGKEIVCGDSYNFDIKQNTYTVVIELLPTPVIKNTCRIIIE